MRTLLRFLTPDSDPLDIPPPLATLERHPRLARGLGVVEFPVFWILVFGSPSEHRGTAGSLSPIGGAVRAPPSRARASTARVLWSFISYRISAIFTWMANPH